VAPSGAGTVASPSARARRSLSPAEPFDEAEDGRRAGSPPGRTGLSLLGRENDAEREDELDEAEGRRALVNVLAARDGDGRLEKPSVSFGRGMHGGVSLTCCAQGFVVLESSDLILLDQILVHLDGISELLASPRLSHQLTTQDHVVFRVVPDIRCLRLVNLPTRPGQSLIPSSAIVSRTSGSPCLSPYPRCSARPSGAYDHAHQHHSRPGD
jgi:hypothetical protein